jgi:hypothetical protein
MGVYVGQRLEMAELIWMSLGMNNPFLAEIRK